MTPDELRALADTLSRQLQLTEHGIYCAVPRQAIDAAIKYLLACADVQPVAKIERVAAGAIALFTPSGGPFDMSKYVGDSLYTHPAPTVPAGYKLVPVEPTPKMVAAAEKQWMCGSYVDMAKREWAAMLTAAPAAPQVVASFYTESDELIGTTYAPIKNIRVEDDGTLHVFIDHWPQPVPAGWKLVPVEPTPEMLSSVGMMDGYDWHTPGCSPDADHANWYSAMIAAAPAAPQAAPMADSDADYWLRNRQPILDAIERAGFMLMSNASGFWLHPRGKTDAQAGPKREDQPLRDLLAVIHCDGGHHTEAVGIEQSIKDAQAAVCELKRELVMGKREPLTALRILEIEDNASRQWRDNGRIIEYAVVFARMIERAHGIGGSDAE